MSAPCGHEWMSRSITRSFRILFPTVWADCRCSECNETWTERFEFDFSVPLGGITWEKQRERDRCRAAAVRPAVME